MYPFPLVAQTYSRVSLVEQVCDCVTFRLARFVRVHVLEVLLRCGVYLAGKPPQQHSDGGAL